MWNDSLTLILAYRVLRGTSLRRSRVLLENRSLDVQDVLVRLLPLLGPRVGDDSILDGAVIMNDTELARQGVQKSHAANKADWLWVALERTMTMTTNL